MRRVATSARTIDAALRAKKVRVRDGISLHPVDDEAILADCVNQKLYRINSTAAFIWCCLEDRISRDHIATCVAQSYFIPETEAVRYVDHAIQQWLNYSLLDDGSSDQPASSIAKPDIPFHTPPQDDYWAIKRDYRLLNTDVQIRFPDPEIATFVDRYFGHLSHSASIDSHPATLDLHKEGNRWAICNGRHVIERLVNTEELIPTLKIALTTVALEQSQDFGALHAAGISRVPGQSCVLIAGVSGSGKSTLTAALAADGFVSLGDDTIVLAKDTLAVRPIPFGICLKEGSWPLLQQRIPSLMNEPIHHRLDGKLVRYCVPLNPRAAFIPSTRTEVSGIVFPCREESGAAFLTPLAHADAATRLISEFCPLGGGLSAQKTDILLHWLARIPCLDLHFSSLEDGTKAIGELLQ